MPEPCTCNEASQAVELKCYRCGDGWMRPLTPHERMCKCPQHAQFVAVCGTPYPELCSGCLAAGYVVRASVSYFLPTFSLDKRAPGETDDGLF